MSHEKKEFRLALKMFLLLSSFYALDEYFNWKLPKSWLHVKLLKIQFYKIL